MPDVTVVVAVYNTMPYLTECLESLVHQSIGHDRLQVVAVDDGSTDGSGETLDRYADQYPDVFEVLHQPNSGGPAGPSNRALDVATGRYVYFLGADDYLGSEALERMVDFADQHDSDVVVGRMVGINGRQVGQGLFGANQIDLDPYGPGLRWALANTKLFRRDLVEKHRLRYREDMPFGSDQPFTLAACVHAGRVSVLADYICYYAVKRDDQSNLSYNTPYADRVPCIGQMMRAVADLVPAGPRRDTILTRHWAWEVPRLLRYDLLQHDEKDQRAVCAGIRGLAEEFLNDDILAAVPVSARVRVSAAAGEDLDLLAEVIRDDSDRALPVFVDGNAAFACYAGFESGALPRWTYRLAAVGATDRLSTSAQLRSCRFTSRSLVVEVFVPLVGPAASALTASARRAGAAVSAGTALVPARVSVAEEKRGALVTVELDQARLAAAGGGVWRLQVDGALETGRFVVRLPVPVEQPVVRAWSRGRPFRLGITGTPRENALAVKVTPISGREVVAAARRRTRLNRK